MWAYRIAYKTPLGMSPYRVVFGRPCHLPAELEHRARWAIRTLNYDLSDAGEERKLSLNELEEIRREAYENACLSKRELKFFMIVKSIGKTSLLDKKCSCITPASISFRGSLGLGGPVLLW